jgi:uncharacterized protein (DUF2147 family)
MKTFKNVIVVTMLSLFSTTTFAQSNFSGEWILGEQNSIVKIEQINGVYAGKIVSSDNPKVEIGKLMVKDLSQTNGKWKGKLYWPKRKEWYSAEFTSTENKLTIKIKVGFFSKTVEWIRK